MLKIKTFKAVDNRDTSLKFAQGHSDVLKSYGIPKVTSSDPKWIDNPDVYVITVDSEDGTEVYGGARLEILNQDVLLPIEEAVGHMDNKVYDLVRKFDVGKTGELCGLWNAKSMSGSGLSHILVRVGVAKAGIALAKQLNLDSLFALCAPWTVKMFSETGYKIETSVGNEGTLPYPKEDLLATVMIHDNLDTLDKASTFAKERIHNLRIEPIQFGEEESPNGRLTIEYNLLY